MGAAYQDRVSGIRSQDEATYSRAAIEMVAGGDWLTPHVLQRFFLYKPPLLYWLSALSVECLGLSRLSLRLPSVLAGAVAIALVFAWCRRLRGWPMALAGALLMLSNSVWQTMSRLALMDVLVASCITLALFFVLRDPQLMTRTSVLGFGCATGAAILAKSVAGLIPILALAAFALLAGAGKRPPLRRVILTLCVTAAVAAPWHLYQLAAHRTWFLAEYVGAQLLGFGAHPPVASQENALWFYARRLFATDPVLVILFLLAIPGLVVAVRRGHAHGVLLGSWLTVTILAVTAFQSRNFLYAVLLIPPLCLIAAGYAAIPPRYERLLLIALVGIGVAKVYANAPWDLAFQRIAPLPSQLNLRSYAERGRSNELILVEPDDEFYAMLLPIHGVRYCWTGQVDAVKRYAPHLFELGITMPSAQFIDLARVEPQYGAALRRWGLASSDALATSIVASSPADVLAVVQSRPASDFYMPRALAEANRDRIAATHSIEPALAGRVFLLAKVAPGAVRWTPIPSGEARL